MMSAVTLIRRAIAACLDSGAEPGSFTPVVFETVSLIGNPRVIRLGFLSGNNIVWI